MVGVGSVGSVDLATRVRSRRSGAKGGTSKEFWCGVKTTTQTVESLLEMAKPATSSSGRRNDRLPAFRAHSWHMHGGPKGNQIARSTRADEGQCASGVASSINHEQRPLKRLLRRGARIQRCNMRPQYCLRTSTPREGSSIYHQLTNAGHAPVHGVAAGVQGWPIE